MWALVHFKRANINCDVLCRVYQIMLRPLLEYCHVIYNSMLSKEQSEKLESLQKRALKIVYGFGFTYEDLLTKAGMQKLQERREDACLKFAKKLSSSDRFRSYFPLNDQCRQVTRNKKTYIEEYARTSRLYDSPLFYFRRILNACNDEDEENLESIFTET